VQHALERQIQTGNLTSEDRHEMRCDFLVSTETLQPVALFVPRRRHVRQRLRCTLTEAAKS
jgi:hypothetical protein